MITLKTIDDVVRRRLAPLLARLNNGISRGVLSTLDDEKGLARGQTSTGADQVADDIEFVTPFGFSSRPPAGAESLVFSVGATAGHLLGFLFDRRVRLAGSLAAGEVAMHIGVADQLVHLKTDGTVIIRAGTDGGTVEVKPNGDVVILPGAAGNVYLGDGAATKKVALADDVDARLLKLQKAFDAHVHATAAVGLPSPPTPVLTLIPVGALAPTASTNVLAKG